MFSRTHVISYTALAVLLVASVGSSVYLFRQNLSLKADPTRQAQIEAKATVAKVSLLMELPTGEDPTVATVSDPEKLKDQAFFANAQKGDTVLIYTTAKKAILYRSSTNKIVDVAPVTTNDQGAAAAPAKAETKPTDTNK